MIQKAAQVGWTFALIGYLGRRIDRDPAAIVMMFAGEEAAREFVDEKLVPTVQATPALAAKMDVTTSRKAGNRALYKTFPGGFLKLGGSRSIHKVKSTPAKLVIVEEPDDAKENLKDQGDAILLLWERIKRARNGKRVLGGTPSLKGLSRVDAHLDLSDKRVLPVRCHDCGESHVLAWEQVSWAQDGGIDHPVFGTSLPDTAVYACPHCGSAWSDGQRRDNIRATVQSALDDGDPWGGWEATSPYHGIRGFHELSELYSCLPGAGLADLVRDYLQAQHQKAMGDENAWIVFVNSKLGRPYEFAGDGIQAEDLADRADDYPELVIPAGGILVTAGVDVQHDRLAVILRAWGRGAESWLMWWGELQATKTCIDPDDPVWEALDDLLFMSFRSAEGWNTHLAAMSIDSSDGHTSDAVYRYVRSRSKRIRNMLIMAVKGSSESTDPEPFSTPRKPVEHHNAKKRTKADRYGVQIYSVGTSKAKDWIDGHLRLTGAGPGRWHWYKGVRSDYLEQITAEVKAPHRRRGRKVWQLRPGKRNEALDCEVYALHAAWSQRVHLLSPVKWDDLAAQRRQSDLFTDTQIDCADDLTPRPAAVPPQQPAPNSQAGRLAALAKQLNG